MLYIKKLSGFFRETYPIKKFTFDPKNAYQSFKLTAVIHLTRKEVLIKTIFEILLVIIFLMMLLLSAMFLIFTANNFWSFFAIAFVYIVSNLENLSP